MKYTAKQIKEAVGEIERKGVNMPNAREYNQNSQTYNQALQDLLVKLGIKE